MFGIEIRFTPKTTDPVKALLRDLPWLWAVKKAWTQCFGEYKIHRANLGYLTETVEKERRIWVKAKSSYNGYGVETVFAIVQRPYQTVADAVCENLGSFIVEYVVIELSRFVNGGPGDLLILRQPSQTESLDEFCRRMRYVRRESESVSVFDRVPLPIDKGGIFD